MSFCDEKKQSIALVALFLFTFITETAVHFIGKQSYGGS